MLGIALCALALIVTLLTARRSLPAGIGVTLFFGYMYGITRANIAETAGHFIFDAAVIGLYAGLLIRRRNPIARRKIRRIMPWFLILVGWPFVMLLMPLQDPMIQLVGFRAQVFFLPFLLIGAMLDDEDLYSIVYWIGALNLLAFGFAIAEYFIGVQKFFPLSEMTRSLVYGSNDVLGNQMRIPSTFVASASYGGVMVLSLPWLVGAWVQKEIRGWNRGFIAVAFFAAAIGVFLSASRTQALILIALVIVIAFTMRARAGTYVGWAVLVGAAAWLVVSAPRLQRVTTIRDASYVETRLHNSANASFFAAAEQHPLGIGLGAGGTSIPYFLRERLNAEDSIVIENEYARIMLEQGLPGLFIWLAFIGWVLTRAAPRRSDKWFLSRRLAYVVVALVLATGAIGIGMLSWAPGTAELLILVGWISAPRIVRVPAAARNRVMEQEHLQPLLFGR
ncbi:MAG TPA: O-antigen ligase family protein [Candidatus Binataceae bacterium]|nr:O-antigen ligase family protein [Candidatus Binataceae bacterium]